MQLANLTTTLAMENATFINSANVSRAAIRALVREFDPATYAQMKFEKQTTALKLALDAGTISTDRYQVMLGNAQKKLASSQIVLDEVTGSQTRMGASGMILQHVLRSTGDSLASGAPLAMVFGQQIGRVAEAAEFAGGSLGKVGEFLSGPWGIAVTAAVAVATPFVAKLFEGNDALTEQVKKLQDNAAKQEIAAEANRVFAGTQAGLEQRIRATTTAIEGENASLRTNAELQNINAKTEYAAAQKKLSDSQALLKAAQNQQTLLTGSLAAADPRIAVSMGADPITLSKNIENAHAAAIQAQKDVEQATAAVINSRVALAAEQATADAAATTVTGKITRQYDDQIKAIKLRTAVAAQGGKDVSVAEYVLIKNLEEEKQAALAAAQAAKSHGGSLASLADAQGRLAAADTNVQRATAQLAVTRAQARAELKAGTITQAEYTAKIRDGQNAVDAAREGAQSHTAAIRADAKATADAIRLIKDASTDAYKAVSSVIADNDKTFMKGFADDAKGWDDIAKQAATAFKAQEEMAAQAEEDLQRKREGNVRDVAGLYYDLFEGGTQRIWQDFEQLGFQIISQVLAKWTVGMATGKDGTGGLLASIGKILGIGGGATGAAAGSTFNIQGVGDIPYLTGFANGGSFQFGGRDGIDKNILSLNGSPIAKVSKGETATIGRGGASNDNPIVVQLVVGEGQMFEPRVQTISGNVAVQTVSDNNRKLALANSRRLPG